LQSAITSAIKLVYLCLHQCTMNHGFGGWVSSFLNVCYGYVSG